jgi:hypothetical protein
MRESVRVLAMFALGLGAWLIVGVALWFWLTTGWVDFD